MKRILFYFSLILLIIESLSLNAQDMRFENTSKGFVEENKGQVFDEAGNYRNDVFFVANFSGADVFFTNEGVVFYFKKIEASEYDKIRSGKISNPYSNKEWEEIMKKISNGEFQGDLIKPKGEFYRIDINFPGAKLDNAVGENMQLEKRHYYNSQHPDGLRNVSLYEKIRYHNVYEGIDLVFYIENGKLKYDFELSANANPSLIKILYKGQENISIDADGNAIVKILPGVISENKPMSFQNGKNIESNFYVSNDTIMFQLGNYDKSQPLTIDPSLAWSTYFYDGAATSASFTYTNPSWDSNGNMFVVLNTYATTFPIINPGGAYTQTVGSTGTQLCIMKFNTSRQVVWSTYYASSAASQAKFTNQSLAIDQNNNLYIIGSVFYVYGCPCTLPLQDMGGGAYYETEQGNNRNFILKFTSAGVRLWATMFNKTSGAGTFSSGLELSGITIDENNKPVVTGWTYTPDGTWTLMPLVNPGGSYYYKGTSTEESVPTLHRFSTTGVLEWGTYIGQGVAGAYNGNNTSIAVDGNNNIFLAGSASGAYTTVNPGGAYVDGVACSNGRKYSIFKFASTGALNWCTLYGGSTNPYGSMLWQDPRDLKVASNGDVVIVGRANANNFPFCNPGSGAYMKTTLSSGSSSVCDGVIMQFSNVGARKWVTYYGGDGTSDGTDFWGLGIDASNNIFVSGISRSPSFPTQSLAGSYNQSTITGDYAVVFAQFNISGVRQWASYFGDKTYYSSGGFGLTNDVCGAKFVQMGYTDNAYSITTVDPGGGAYYHLTKEGVTGQTDFIAEFSSSITPVTPTFTALGPYCVGATPGTLPTTSTNGITGTWSPSTISTATAGTTTYTFTPAAGSCATSTTMSVTVNTNVAPTFTALGSYCVGATPGTLPTTSTNGISGTWSPSVISTATAGTTTYTFTPTTGECATSATMSVTVSANVTPTFTALGPYCVGATPGTLPTTSTNGISGTWSPSVISTATAGTTTYTFTPTTGECATSATMSVTVSANVTPTFAALGPYCVGAIPDALPSTSTNGKTGTWSPSVISTATAGTATYTFTPAAGECATTTTMSVTVSANVTPTFTALGPYCVGATPGTLPTTSTNGISGTWSPSVISTATAGTTTYTFTPAAGSCATSTTMSVTVNTNVTPTFAALGPYCVGAIPDALQSGSTNGITGTWSPSTISTATAGTTTYTFTPAAGSCATSTTMSITVNTNVTPTFAALGPYCVGAIPDALQSGSTNGITGTWSPSVISTATAGTTTYTFTPAAGSCATSTTMSITVNTNATPTFTALGPYCVGAMPDALQSGSTNGITGTWSPSAISTATAGTTIYTFTPTAGGCASSTTMSVMINALPTTPTISNNGPICPGDNAVFTITGASGATVAYSGVTGTPVSPVTIGAGGTATVTVNGATISQTITIGTVSNGSCSITPSNVTSTVTVNSATVLTSATATPSTICPGGSSNLSAISTGNTINWWSDATGGTLLGSAASGGDFTVSPTVTTTYYAEVQAQLGAGGSQSFNYTGAQQTWTVPAGVTSVNLELWGAQGGNGYWANDVATGNGGKGGYSTGSLAVTPGQTLYIYVGQQGPVVTGTGVYTGAYNGGGQAFGGTNGNRGAGGGASDIRVGGTALTNRVIVAGGGGGAYSVDGGAGGGLSGVSGTGDFPGSAGSQTAGGAPYTPTNCSSDAMQYGSLGQGGGIPNGCSITEAGGGGGYYGGACGNSAGGGSSYIGGVTSGSTTAGVREGNGLVTITWTSASNCPTASRTPVTVTVANNATPTFTALGPYCVGTVPDALPTTSTNGITGTWSPSTISTAAAGTTIYTFTPAAGVCATSATMSVTVNPLPTISTLTDISVCVGTAVPIGAITSVPAGATYTWTNNNTSIGLAASGIGQVPAFTAINATSSPIVGIVTVTPTLGTCVGMPVSYEITVNPMDSPAFNYTPSTMCQTGTDQSAIITGGSTGTFTAVPTGLVFLNTTTGLIDVSASTLNSYTITFTTNGTCPSSGNFNISITSAPNATFSYAGPYCSNGADPYPVFSAGASAGVFSATPTGLVFVNTATGQIDLSASAAGTYIITNTIAASGGCAATVAKDTIIITALPTADISYTGFPWCTSAGVQPVSLTGTNAYTGGTYSSTAGLTIDAATGQITPGTSTAGTYTVTYTVAASGGCSIVTDTTSVTIIALPIAGINATTTLLTCTTTAINATANGGVNYSWDGGATPTTATNSFTTPGTYTVTVSTTDGCSATTSIAITQDTAAPLAGITNNTNTTALTCNISFISVIATGGSSYQWSGGATTTTDANSFAVPGTYTVTVTGANGCTATSEITITQDPQMEISLLNTAPDHCAKGIGEATVTATGGSGTYTFTWDGVDLPGSNAVSHAANLFAGSYEVTISDGNCLATITVVINNIPGPTAAFEPIPTEVFKSKPEFQFHNESIGGSTYSWSFGDGTFSTEESPAHHYLEYGASDEYVILLEVTDNFGCKDTVSHKVIILDDLNIFIPNTFTPNGDGINDEFKPRGIGYSLEGYEMNIYDRWGKLLFISNDFYKGWNGKVDGTALNINAVFVYKIIIYDLKGKKFIYTGHVTLLGSKISEY